MEPAFPLELATSDQTIPLPPQTLAKHYALPCVDLQKAICDPALLQPALLQDYLTHRAVPLYKNEDGTTVVATSEMNDALLHWAGMHYKSSRFVIASAQSISGHIQIHFAKTLDHISRFKLWHMAPDKSARLLFTSPQKRAMVAACLFIGFCFACFPQPSLLAFFLLINLFYFFTLTLKTILFAKGCMHHLKTLSASELVDMPEEELPIYTILVPLHDEANSLPRLFHSFEKLDYPKTKLDIKLILEQSDSKTAEALKKLDIPKYCELLHVPYSLPQTKPKACNFALNFARGEYITIYDAEDDPDPLQLKKAALQFRRSDRLPFSERPACFQARLNYYNRAEGWLPQLFSLEYALWFDYMLPGLQSLGMPIPLGGTSNHFRLQELRGLGAWDPFNVTEDADLGMRLALSGRKTAMLDSLTKEEAPKELGVWIKQRTRWIRGYMQTWIVHMRHPIRLYHSLPLRAFLGFQLFIGGPCLLFLTAPVLWLISLRWLTGIGYPASLPEQAAGLTIFNLIFWLTSHIVYAAYIMHTQHWDRKRIWIILFPFYGCLHSIAAYRALWQLMKNPHIWEKTPHAVPLKKEA